MPTSGEIETIHARAWDSWAFLASVLPGSRGVSRGDFREWWEANATTPHGVLYQYEWCERDFFAIRTHVCKLGFFVATSHHRLIAKMTDYVAVGIERYTLSRVGKFTIPDDNWQQYLTTESVLQRLSDKCIRAAAARLKIKSKDLDNFDEELKLEFEFAMRLGDGRAIKEQSPAIAVTDDDLLILAALAKDHPKAVLGVSIEQALHVNQTPLSRRHIERRLKYLRSTGLTSRPFGMRKGTVITDAGLAIIAAKH